MTKRLARGRRIMLPGRNQGFAMPELNRLDIILPPDHEEEEAELLQGRLALHVSHGWEETSLPTGELLCRVHSVVPETCDELMLVLPPLLPRARFERSAVEDKNWMEAWKEFFTPVEAGAFVVLAPWMGEELRQANEQGTRIPIVIEPKTAFGTGHHPTTALCLEALSDLHAQGRLQKGMRFLDLGAGSGILGIGCAKLGLTGDGLDIESPAIANCEENREINQVEAGAFRVELGSVEKASGPYDVVLANILAQPLRLLAPDMAALRNAKGDRPLLILSGMLDIQAESVEQAYKELGFLPAQRLSQGEWVALVFQ